MDALQATAMDLDDAAEAPPDPLEVAFEAAANASDPGAAYLAVLTDAEHALTEAGARAKEQCVYKLAERDSKNKNFGDVAVLLERAAPFFGQVAKAKVAKIVRKLLDIVAAHADTLDLQAELCLKVVAWCRAEKRTFLRQRGEARLVQIDFERARYDDALSLVTRLLRELKQLDDKQMLVETHLVEAKIHGALRNVPKAKAALTAARTNGTAVYVGPRLQAELAEMSGSLHCEEQDYHTAHSYFLEAYEAYDTLPDREADATRCLKYMLLCQILQEPLKGSARGADALLDAATAAATSAQYVKYAGPNLDSMAAVARAAKARSLAQFEACTAKYGAQLRSTCSSRTTSIYCTTASSRRISGASSSRSRASRSLASRSSSACPSPRWRRSSRRWSSTRSCAASWPRARASSSSTRSSPATRRTTARWT